MKICLVYLGRRNAGPVFSLELAKSLRYFSDVKCIISSEVTNKNEWYKQSFEVVEVHTYRNILEFIFSFFKLNIFLRIKREIKKYSPDIIIYPMIHLWLPVISLLARKYKQVYVAHDPKPHIGENILNVIVNKFMLKNSDGIVVLSNKWVDYLVNLGIEKRKIAVIKHGSLSYYTQPCLPDNKKERSKSIILFFGRIDKYKGIDVLLDIFERIISRKKMAELWIVGEGDLKPYLPRIKANENVKVVNRYIDDKEISTFFNHADFLILPYIEATQSGVIPLAYAFGKPVIASRVGGIPEQVLDGETGFLFDINDINTAVEKAIFLMENENKRTEMGKKAFEYQKVHLDWNKIGAELIRFLTQICEE